MLVKMPGWGGTHAWAHDCLWCFAASELNGAVPQRALPKQTQTCCRDLMGKLPANYVQYRFWRQEMLPLWTWVVPCQQSSEHRDSSQTGFYCRYAIKFHWRLHPSAIALWLEYREAHPAKGKGHSPWSLFSSSHMQVLEHRRNLNSLTWAHREQLEHQERGQKETKSRHKAQQVY